jgi:hypothetical protein
MEYAWKKGIRFKADPNKTGELLEIISSRYGIVTPQLVLKEGSDPDSVIHSEFEWNDEKAANLYRIDTARRIIRHLRVVSKGSITDEPVYVHVTEGDRSYYQKTYVAVENPDIWAKVMIEERIRLQTIKKRLDTLKSIEKDGSRISITSNVSKSIEEAINPLLNI